MDNESMYAELLELITTDSASGKESAIARLLIGKLEALGFAVTMDNAGETFGGECGNVLGVREGELDGALLLCSHMDRVPEGLGIHPVERDGVLYSDGSTILAADDISGVCAILDGLRRVLAAKVPLPRLEVLFTVGEETGLYGAKAMDLSKLHAKMGYFFDSPGSVGRFVHGAPGPPPGTWCATLPPSRVKPAAGTSNGWRIMWPTSRPTARRWLPPTVPD